MNVTQQLVATVHRCEELAVQEAGTVGSTDSWALLRGRALDAYVCHVIHSGAVADPVEDLRSHWSATNRPADIEALEAQLGDGDTAKMVEDLSLLAARAGAFGDVGEHAPRVEVSFAYTAGETIRLPGRIDVLLGGPGTEGPAALVEVKSGTPRSDHAAQLRHYVMLAALVHGRMPAAAAIWYPAGEAAESPEQCLEVPVAGTVTSSAMRVVAALERVAELWEGRVPNRSGGPHCNWCPLSGDCEASRKPVEWTPGRG